MRERCETKAARPLALLTNGRVGEPRSDDAQLDEV
ncbi:hypothetical protein J2W56_002464 [Nocardia kruczakiae]|uniref:Uncharacterized protein n=1 Tax=Nocardia kruczakiae TaxID=261477 RepID=A0ABU1XDV7_9NOCA|nr:hypothetical protein [Nocardia kruczakiae]